MTDHCSNRDFLLNFGDSWAHAGGVGPQNGYSYLMSSSLKFSWLDYSQPSTSVASMVLQLQTFLQKDYNPNHTYTALFFITAQERQLLFDYSDQPWELHPQGYPEYYRTYYNHRLGNHCLNTTVIVLQSLCQRYKINDNYLLGWQLPKFWHEVDVTKFYDHAHSNAVNMMAGPDADLTTMMTRAHPCLISQTNGHPSQQGHRKIAEQWLRWIVQSRQSIDQ